MNQARGIVDDEVGRNVRKTFRHEHAFIMALEVNLTQGFLLLVGAAKVKKRA
jgi:hypothetical protein